MIKAREKHVGIDDYWFAQALARIRDITKLPKMIKDVTLEELKVFFEDKVKEIMKL